MRQAPPTRTSASQTGLVNSFGPHQRARCSGSVHALNTSSRGASKTRVITTSRSIAVSLAGVLGVPLADILSLLFFHFHQIFVETIKAFFPEAAILLHPFGDVLER